MAAPDLEHPAVRRGRAARQSERLARAMDTLPYLTRKLPPVEVISTEGLEQIEDNADTLLEQVGIEIVNFPEAIEIFRGAGADIEGQRVRFPRGMCRELVQATRARGSSPSAPATRPAASVIGDPHMVLVPTYGSPFIHNLDDGRRYATIEDFRNFVKLTYMSHTLHHGGGTLCEPVDLPVNKRHFEMVYSHIRYSDRAFMGSVTHPSRAQDSVDMAQIVFGAETLENEHVIMGLANANSPMSWDFNMLGSAKVYAENNQIMLDHPVHPRRRDGAGDGRRRRRPRRSPRRSPGWRSARSSGPARRSSSARSRRRCRCSRARPTFGTPEPQLVLFVLAALARRLGVPFRSGGNFTASKLPDYQAAYESAISFMATMQAGVNFNLHTAGWLEGGLAIGYEKFILDEDQASMTGAYISGVDTTDNGYALDAMLAGGPGQHFLGSPHTLANFENAFWRSELSNNDSFEQWELDGGLDAAQRANAALEAPPGRVRDAAARRGDPRGARRVDGPAQGELPGLGRLTASRRQPVRPAARIGRRRRSTPALRPSQPRPRPGRDLAGGLLAGRRRQDRRIGVGRASLEPAQLLERDVAAHHVPRLDLDQRRLGHLAQAPDDTRGSGCGRRSRVGGLAGLGISPSRRIRRRSLAVDVRHRRQQRLGVRVVRAAEDRLRVADLHDPAEVHARRSGRPGSGRRRGRGR